MSIVWLLMAGTLTPCLRAQLETTYAIGSIQGLQLLPHGALTPACRLDTDGAASCIYSSIYRVAHLRQHFVGRNIDRASTHIKSCTWVPRVPPSGAPRRFPARHRASAARACKPYRALPQAVINDARWGFVREQVQGLRQRVCAAHAAASGWP